MTLQKPDLNKPIFRLCNYKNAAERIKNDLCPFCPNKITEDSFRDEESKEEYTLSGLCQGCQDKTFGREK